LLAEVFGRIWFLLWLSLCSSFNEVVFCACVFAHEKVLPKSKKSARTRMSEPQPPSTVTRFRMPQQNLDNANQRDARRKQRRLTRTEFAKRIRFRDAAGYRYALPEKSDDLYRQYRSKNLIDAFENDDDDDDDDDEEDGADNAALLAREERRTLGKRALLYASKPITRRRVAVPRAGVKVRLLDLASKHVFEGRVERFFFERRERGGHTVLRDVVNTGPVVDIAEFADASAAAAAASSKRK
jgi:hypothetical protein